MRRDKFSNWELMILLLGLENWVYRIKLIRWLVRCVPLVFRGCNEFPVPKRIYQRILWYTRRFFGLFRLYKWMMDHHHLFAFLLVMIHIDMNGRCLWNFFDWKSGTLHSFATDDIRVILSISNENVMIPRMNNKVLHQQADRSLKNLMDRISSVRIVWTRSPILSSRRRERKR